MSEVVMETRDEARARVVKRYLSRQSVDCSLEIHQG